MKLDTTFLNSKRVMIPLIGLVGYVIFAATGVQIPEQTITEALTQVLSSGEVLVSTAMLLWNVVTKVLDTHKTELKEAHLNWWDLVGVFKELMKVLNIFKK